MILAIDTSGPVVGICLAGLGVEPQSWSARAGRGADAVLVPAIADLLSGAPAPLTGVALTTGPGAFTGLRVGLAIGTGIALARNVLVLPMGSLAARALLALDAPEVLAVLDARKGRVYARRFRSTPRGPEPLGDAEDVDLHDVLALVGPGCVAVGEGASVYAEALAAAGVAVVAGADASPAQVLALYALTGALQPCDPGAVRLAYVRPPDAKVPKGMSLVGPPPGPSR